MTEAPLVPGTTRWDACNLDLQTLLLGRVEDSASRRSGQGLEINTANHPILNHGIKDAAQALRLATNWTDVDTWELFLGVLDAAPDEPPVKGGSADKYLFGAKVLMNRLKVAPDETAPIPSSTNGRTLQDMRNDDGVASLGAFSEAITVRKAYLSGLLGFKAVGSLKYQSKHMRAMADEVLLAMLQRLESEAKTPAGPSSSQAHLLGVDLRTYARLSAPEDLTIENPVLRPEIEQWLSEQWTATRREGGISVLWGRQGMGKSTALARFFSDMDTGTNRFYVDASKTRRLSRGLAVILEHEGVSGDEAAGDEATIQLFSSRSARFAHTNVLIIDGLDDPEQLLSLFPSSPNYAVFAAIDTITAPFGATQPGQVRATLEVCPFSSADIRAHVEQNDLDVPAGFDTALTELLGGEPRLTSAFLVYADRNDKQHDWQTIEHLFTEPANTIEMTEQQLGADKIGVVAFTRNALQEIANDDVAMRVVDALTWYPQFYAPDAGSVFHLVSFQARAKLPAVTEPAIHLAIVKLLRLGLLVGTPESVAMPDAIRLFLTDIRFASFGGAMNGLFASASLTSLRYADSRAESDHAKLLYMFTMSGLLLKTLIGGPGGQYPVALPLGRGLSVLRVSFKKKPDTGDYLLLRLHPSGHVSYRGTSQVDGWRHARVGSSAYGLTAGLVFAHGLMREIVEACEVQHDMSLLLGQDPSLYVQGYPGPGEWNIHAKAKPPIWLERDFSGVFD